jgi:hypothetical protein
MNFILGLVSIFLISLSAAAHTSVTFGSCWQNEFDFASQAMFASELEYDRLSIDWKKVEPPSPDPVSLAYAYSIYKNEQTTARAMGNDKAQHCYFGCRFSQRLSYQTANYLAWLKENRDLHDCNTGTRFEPQDYEATMNGAEIGRSYRTKQACVDFCSQALR